MTKLAGVTAQDVRQAVEWAARRRQIEQETAASRPRAGGYAPQGAIAVMWEAPEEEVIVSGPAGTGKTRGMVEKLHDTLRKTGQVRALLVRKTLTDLAGAALRTYREQVLQEEDGVVFYGGSAEEPPQFRYPNGSRLYPTGMESESKALSREVDVVCVNEVTELSDGDWETLLSRLRGTAEVKKQIVGDCNPSYPGHWIQARRQASALRVIESRHEDNPRLYNTQSGEWTDEGRRYLSILDRLTGVRKERLRYGRWTQAEGVVYELWDAAVHKIPRFAIPWTWRRWWVCDFGYTNPLCLHAWAEDEDGRLYLYREFYQTKVLVEHAAAAWLAVCGEDPLPTAIITDHDAEDRATLELHLGLGATTPAYKSVSPGIQAVQMRLQVAGDQRARLFVFDDALTGAEVNGEWRPARDPALEQAGKPCGLVQEIESYVWDVVKGRKAKEVPVKDDDHGCDCVRYLVAAVDGLGIEVPRNGRAVAGGKRAHLEAYRRVAGLPPGLSGQPGRNLL